MYILHAGTLSALLAAALSAAPFKPEQTIARPKRLYPETALVERGRLKVTVVVPADDAYAAPGARVAKAIRAATGARVPIKSEADLDGSDRAKHLICLGKMTNNRVILRLYALHLCACDDWFPGPGGFVVRTACDPWGTGRNVIILGGSDREGVERAVARFVELLRGGTNLPRLAEVHLPGIEKVDAWAPAAVEEFRKNFVRAPALPYLAEKRWIRMAELYFLTGRDEFARAWVEGLRRWMDEYYKWVPYRQITTPKYVIPRMILDFDMMEEHPALPDELRLEYTNLLYDYVSRMGVHPRIVQLRPGVLADTGHHQVSLVVTYGARYFKTYYPRAPMERIEKGLASVKVGLETIEKTGGWFDENGGYTKFYPQTTMLDAIFLDDMDYFSSGNAQRWLRQRLILTSNLPHSVIGLDGLDGTFGPPSLAMGEWYYRSGHWRWLLETLHRRTDWRPRVTDQTLEAFPWLWMPDVPAVEPTEGLLGIQWQPLDPLVYAQLGRKGKKINVPRERTFHAVAMRSRFDPQAPYLLLDGINDGISKGGDGNAVVVFTSAGRSWLTAGKWGSSSSKYQNTVLVLRNGQLPDKPTALCDLEYAADHSRCGFVRSVMREVNGADWARGVVWLKDGWFAVIDSVRCREAGDFNLFCQWRTTAPSELDGRTFRARAGEAEMQIISAGGAQLQAVVDEGVHVFREALYGRLAAGDSRTFINLLRATGTRPKAGTGPDDLRTAPVASNAGLSLRLLSPGAAVALGEGAPVIFGMAEGDDLRIPLNDGFAVKAALFLMTPDRLDALDFGGLFRESGRSRVTIIPPQKTGDVELDLKTLRAGAGGAALEELFARAAEAAPPPPPKAREPVRNIAPAWTWRHPKAACVNALEFLPDGRLAVGASDGSVTLLDRTGRPLWTFSAEKAVNDVAAADLTGDGRPEVLVASDDFHVYCLDDNGRVKWRFSTEGHSITNQTAGEFGPGRTVSSEGEVVCLMLVDLDGDGRGEVLAGTKTFMHGRRRVFGTTWCLDGATGSPRWHLYQSAGCVISMDAADVDGDQTPEIAVGTGGGTYGRSAYLLNAKGEALNRFAGPYGEKYVRLARLREGGPMRLVRMEQRDGLLEVFSTAAPYALVWSQPCGGLTAYGPVVADVNGDGTAEVIVASSAGNCYAWNESPGGGVRPVWRVNLMEALSAVISAEASGKKCVVVGSQQGNVHVLDGDGRPISLLDAGGPVTVLAFGADAGGVAVGTATGVAALAGF